MKSSITLVTDDQLSIIIVVVFVAYLARHILQPFVPFLSSNVHGSEPQIALTSLSAAQTLGQGSVEDIELVVERQLLVILNILESKYTDRYLP